MGIVLGRDRLDSGAGWTGTGSGKREVACEWCWLGRNGKEAEEAWEAAESRKSGVTWDGIGELGGGGVERDEERVWEDYVGAVKEGYV